MGENGPLTPSDEELLSAWATGDEAAFRVLFERYAERLYRVMRREVGDPEQARDLVQQTFVQLHRARLDYDPRRPARPWIFTIARNVKRDWYRRHIRRPEGHAVDGDNLPEPSTQADQERRLAGADVRTAVASLPAAQREVVQLHWFEGLPFPEVAEIVGASTSAVKVRAHRAYQRLRELLASTPVTIGRRRTNNKTTEDES